MCNNIKLLVFKDLSAVRIQWLKFVLSRLFDEYREYPIVLLRLRCKNVLNGRMCFLLLVQYSLLLLLVSTPFNQE